MLDLRIIKSGNLYGGKSLALALSVYPFFKGLSIYGTMDVVSIYIADGTTQTEQDEIVAAALAHTPFSMEPDPGPLHGITLDDALAWIDTNVNSITDLASAKLVMARALKAIARRLLVG